MMTVKEKFEYAINFAKDITQKSDQEICDFYEYVQWEIFYWKWPENPQQYFENILELYFILDFNKNNTKEDLFSILDYLRYELNSYCSKNINIEFFLNKMIDLMMKLDDNNLDIYAFLETLIIVFESNDDKLLVQNIIKNHSEKGKFCIKKTILNDISEESIEFYKGCEMYEYIDRIYEYKRLYIDFEPINKIN